ncbi:MAG TPA: HAD-IIIC family phosphatase [Bryobacteraceae bacterium]|nr:HAD-IIIC family phosphatase [Bryobacteraceae bacterium]
MLRQNAAALSQALYRSVREEACASWKIPQKFEEVEEWGRSQLLTSIDLLVAWFETGNPLYRELFAGWVHSRMIRELSEEGAPSDYKPDRAIEFTKTAWTAILESRCSAEAMRLLESELDQAASLLSKPALKKQRILFIGDCIQFEIIAALSGPCAAAQISFEPTIINERVQPILRNRIRTLGAEFDLVFFSPFSHRYLPEYDVLLNPASLLWSGAKTSAHVDTFLKEVLLTVDTLASQLQCPIYVHNTAGAIQSFDNVSGLAKNLMSRRNRAQAREIINRGIANYLNGPSLESNVRLLNEDSLRAGASELQLGQTYLNSHAFHPTRLGCELGRALYFEAVFASTFLTSKKVVVCDLDNTLWDGVIGEGAVKHYLDRQATLKELRRRGVLLSINSKNDPTNVQWAGAALEAADFVAPQINWNPKAANMAAIRDELNLKLKDFVFIDDRPDELERIKNAFPDVLTLNAAEAATWKLLAHWQGCLPSQPDEDRTRQYHERVERDRFVSELSRDPVTLEDETAALKALQISVKIVESSRSGLKRAAELINRTNQFNLCGSRTTARELEDGMGLTHSVITVEAADKFGSMGVVGVMRVDWKPEGLEIPVFVLSCRAFGFGIEYALLNSLKTLVEGDHPIAGLYKETQYNQPCRQLYPASGMKWDGKRWIGRTADLPADPDWLKIENAVARKDWAVAELATPTP